MTMLNVGTVRKQVLVDEQQFAQLQSEFGRRAVELERLRNAFETLASVNAPARFVAAAMALCNELASRFKAERVGVGFLKGRYVRLKALSHTEKITRHMQLVQDIEAAMEECLDQDVEIILPPPKDASFVYRAAEKLANRHGCGAVLSLPLRRKNSLTSGQDSRENDVVAVLTLERTADKPLTLPEIETLRLTCDLFTARLVDLYEHDKWFGAKAARETRKGFAWVVGTKHTWAKVIAVGVAALIAFAVLAKGTRKVEGQFVLEPIEKQIVTSPFDGYLQSVAVTPGDFVLTPKTAAAIDQLNGASNLFPLVAWRTPVSVLATLRTDDLTNKMVGAMADVMGHTKQAQIYRKSGISKEADAQVEEAEAAKSQAEVDLYKRQIDSATIKAPVDGLVLSGDLKTKIGAQVKAGEELFQVGEPDKIRAEISVPEDQITDVAILQHGDLAASSFPGEHIPFTVERIDPIAAVVATHNVFKVRVKLDPAQQKPWMRPGMEGIAKIDVGQAPYAAIWTRRLVNWVRMKLWI